MRTLYEAGDNLKAERIAVTARDIDKIRIINDTSRHRAQATKLRGSVYCVIDLPFRSIRKRKI